MDRPTKNRRYNLLDELRGLAVIAMVLYHALFLLGEVFGGAAMRDWFHSARPVQPFIAGTFILICGICCRLSRSNLKRGLRLAGFAVALTLSTYAITLIGIDEIILFGVLHFLAVAILVFCLLDKALTKLPPLPQFLLFFLLFFLTANLPLPRGNSLPLFILGFPSRTWHSADYFPLIPWLFLFLAGTAIGIYAKQGRLPAFFDKPRCAALRWVGKYALWIYLLHQPLMFALVTLYQFIT